MKVNIGDYPKKGERKVKVEISSSDLWSLDYTLALVILPALEEFRKNIVGFGYIDPEDVPGDFDDVIEMGYSLKRYEAFLDEIIWTFRAIIEDGWDMTLEESIAHEERIKRGLILFGKYYRTLWQ